MVTNPGRPVIAVVSGPPGAGKSTLAHALATELGVPAIIRDEIKQGMVLATATDEPNYDGLNIPALDAFFAVLTVLARAGVSVVAEAAFQDKLWRPNLMPLTEFAEIRVIHCTAPAEVLHERIARRARTDPHRRAHADRDLLAEIASGARAADTFVPVQIEAAGLVVDTTEGYRPGLQAITEFVSKAAAARDLG
ncbi:AAA family ATPase [Nocardia sp. XZ_19_385]|uniref:AAA family ATPase n=1 Tax=Nocardia sp. XZ_19_385 TaxID=2769488 RepID=UPI00188EA6C8|nr:AAA family ATPase [Nocardia sp. XZ_19_385]